MRFTKNLENPIRRARHQRNLTQKALADKARVHYTQISRIENGLTARPDELARLAGVLGVSVKSLTAGGAQ